MKKEEPHPSYLISKSKLKNYESMFEGDVLTLITTVPYDDDAAAYLIFYRYRELLDSIFYRKFVSNGFSNELLRTAQFDDFLTEFYLFLRGEKAPYWDKLRSIKWTKPESFSCWLFVTAKNWLSDYGKKIMRGLHGATLVNPDDLEDKNHPSSAYGRASNKPRAEDFAIADLLTAISELDEARRMIVLKKLNENLSSRKIALLLQQLWEEMGKKVYNDKKELVIPDNRYVDNQMKKAKEDIKEILIKRFYDDNDMPMTDQLLFAFVEGKANDTERGIVRNYLYKNPQECDAVAILMDSTYGVKPAIGMADKSNCSISSSLTRRKRVSVSQPVLPSPVKGGQTIGDRLNILLTEIISMH